MVGRRRRLEDEFEAAIGDRVGIGEGDPRQLRPLGHLGHRQGERAEPGAGAADQIGFLGQQPLRRVFRLFGAVAGVGDDQIELGAAKRLDAARVIDLLERHLGAHPHQLSLPRPRAGQGRDHRDLNGLGLRPRRNDAEARHRQRAQRQPGGHAAPCRILVHLRISFYFAGIATRSTHFLPR